MFVVPVLRGSAHLSPAPRATLRSRDALLGSSRNEANAVWANSAGATEARAVFDISGEGFIRVTDRRKEQ